MSYPCALRLGVVATAVTLAACTSSVSGTPTTPSPLNTYTSSFVPVATTAVTTTSQRTTTTTHQPTTAALPLVSAESQRPTVHAGAFCKSAGATGVTSTGKLMTCKSASDGHLRWQEA